MLWGRPQVVALVVMASSVLCMTRTAINRVIICSYDHMHRSAKGSRYQMRMDVWEGLLAGKNSIIWGTHHQSYSDMLDIHLFLLPDHRSYVTMTTGTINGWYSLVIA